MTVGFLVVIFSNTFSPPIALSLSFHQSPFSFLLTPFYCLVYMHE